MSILWSSTGLPNPTQSYGGDSSTPVLNTEMETGQKRKRRRFNRLNTAINLSWVFTNEQFDTFKEFFTNTTEGGMLWFEIPLPGEDLEEGLVALTKVRFADSKYNYRYRPHARWSVSANFDKYIDAGPADPELDLAPVWFRQEINLIEDFVIDPETHKDALFIANPGAGQSLSVTVPAIAGVGDQVDLGIRLTGAGSVVFLTDGEDPDGPAPDPPTLLESLLAKLPWALWDASSVVETSGSITRLNDLSGNGRHLNDAQVTGARAVLSAGAIMTTEGTRSVLASLSTGTIPTKFHAFMLFKAGADLIAEASDTLHLFSAGSAPTNGYGWVANCVAGFWRTFGATSATSAVTTEPYIDMTKPVLIEMIYDGSNSKQDIRVNGHQSGATFGSFAHANFNWSNVRIGGAPTSGAGFSEEAYIYNLTMFNTTSNWLTEAVINDVVDAYHTAYPDTNLKPRKLV